MLENEKTAREIGDRKSTYVDEIQKLGGFEDSSLRWYFYELEPSQMSAVDARKVSKVWVE